MDNFVNKDLKTIVGLKPHPKPVWFNRRVAGTPLCYLSLTRLSHQSYAEVQTDFVQRYMGQLDGYWSIRKTDTSFHKLTFNNNYGNPLILAPGWNKFKEWHDLPTNVEIELMYFGNNMFEICLINNIDLSAHVPAYHSRSLHPYCTAVFDIQLNPVNIRFPKLPLPKDLADFIRKYGFLTLLLCVDNGECFAIDVLNVTDLSRSMKFGRNWDTFCESYKFKADDLIRLKFYKDWTGASSRCHVFKLNV